MKSVTFNTSPIPIHHPSPKHGEEVAILHFIKYFLHEFFGFGDEGNELHIS